jgi:hypothetical protein
VSEVRDRRRLILAIYAFAFGVLPAFVLIWFSIRYFATWRGPFDWGPQTMETIEELASPLIAELEKYKADHGRYPATLNQVGLWSVPTYYGPLEYTCLQGGADYSLTRDAVYNHGLYIHYRSSEGWRIAATTPTRDVSPWLDR